MAYEVPGYKLTAHVADSDFENDAFTFVEISEDNTIVIASNDTTFPVGVLQNNPDEGEAAEIMVSGVTKVKSTDDSISAGDTVTWDDNGEAAVAGTDDAIVGIALETLNEDTDDTLISVLLLPISLNGESA